MSRPISGGQEFRHRALRAGFGCAPQRSLPERHLLDRASPASGWQGPNRAANRRCPRRYLTFSTATAPREHIPKRINGRLRFTEHDRVPQLRSVVQGFVQFRRETRTKCSECGEDTTVPFKPTQGRPVLCRLCFRKQGTLQPAAIAGPSALPPVLLSSPEPSAAVSESVGH